MPRVRGPREHGQAPQTVVTSCGKPLRPALTQSGGAHLSWGMAAPGGGERGSGGRDRSWQVSEIDGDAVLRFWKPVKVSWAIQRKAPETR